MYNTGSVGDCLFLQFKKKKQTSFTMLIDCGGYNTDTATIQNCVKDIKNTIGNQPIDIVVVTHEHLDHVSGFNQAKAIFDSISFNQVWMAWTEDPTDPVAKKLKKDLGKKLKAVLSSLGKQQIRLSAKIEKTKNNKRLKDRLTKYSASHNEMLEALHFENGSSLKAALKGLKVSDAMSYVKGKSKSKDKDKMFHKPGEVIQLKGVGGIKFHILGPPYDEDLSGIRNKMQKDEMYSLSKHVAFARNQAFLSAASGSTNSVKISKSPFNEKYFLSASESRKFFADYHSEDMLWRQIEEDWLDASEELAIAVNTFTNNTSLVIAMEFESSGKVLLFPADAQSGNWISWHNPVVTQALKKNGGKTAKELLNNTVLYKVGHHGSHNGTASKSGLDKMNKLEVAMMPLVQDKVPSQWGGSKNFPAKALYTELIKKTNGAIIRTDEGAISDKRAVELRKKNLSASELKELNSSDKGLYQEWTINA